LTQTNEKVLKLIKFAVPPAASIGDASIFEKHPNFFVNRNNATFHDMIGLIDLVRNKVRKKTGVNLDLEIVILE
jgi:UDP-N-acetylmuramate dehydrogenase